MTLKKLLNSQTLKLIKEFKKDKKEIFDIAIYGSTIRNKINNNDLDIAIIFSQPVKLKKKLELAQELKNNLKKTISQNMDIKYLDIDDILDNSFMARQGIIAEGFLILKKKFLHEIIGFENYYIFSYTLKNLTASKKAMFQYALYGRRGEEGLIKSTKSSSIARGAIKVPLQHSEEFKEFFKKNNIKYKIIKGLFY